VILKGPYLRGASLAEGCVVFRFLASSHTWSPMLYGVKFDGTSRACDRLMASAVSFLTWLIKVRWSFNGGDEVILNAWWTRGICPMMSLNGAFLVVVLGQVLKVNWARGNRWCQLF
jgi:hypothetical protein